MEVKDERRKNPRVVVRVLVDFESADTYLYDYSNDLSEGGIFIETEKPYAIGTPVTLRFTLPDIQWVFEAKGKVAWVHQGEKLSLGTKRLGIGMGVEFLEIEAKDRELIRKFVGKTSS